MNTLFKFSVRFFVFLFVFVSVSIPAFALNDFRAIPVASFQSIDPYGTISHTFEIGDKDVFLSRVHIEPRNATVQVRSITFRNLGTTEQGDITNICLYVNDAKIAGPLSVSEEVVMNLLTPYLVQPGLPLSFELRGDIADGSGKTVGFDPVVASNIQVVDENNRDLVRLYKSELSQAIVLDTIASKSLVFRKLEVQTASGPFSDMSAETSEGIAVAYLHEQGIVNGYPDGQYKPTKTVNRVEALKILLEAKYDSVGETSYRSEFPDLEQNQWYVKYVLKALDLGIVKGYPDGQFKPGATINTAEFLKMMHLVFAMSENLAYSFKDVSEADWFAPYAGSAEYYNMFPERGDYLRPAAPLTRGDMAVAMYQYLKNK
jgi:hypothetical protein